MKKFNGLLKKEWVLYRLWIFAAFMMGLAILYLLPFALSKGNLELITDELHFGLMMATLVMGSLFILIQFLSSIRSDVHKKDIWLHSTSSIVQLLGVKMLFTGVSYLVYMVLFTSLGMYTVNDLYEGSFPQILFLQSIIVGVALSAEVVFFVTIIVFYALYLTLKRYIGRFAILITAILFL